jgi:hypothetical protein
VRSIEENTLQIVSRRAVVSSPPSSLMDTLSVYCKPTIISPLPTLLSTTKPARESKNASTKAGYKVTAILLYGFECRKESAQNDRFADTID